MPPRRPVAVSTLESMGMDTGIFKGGQTRRDGEQCHPEAEEKCRITVQILTLTSDSCMGLF